MTRRHAACACGQLKITVEGEPVRVSVCHCLACQQRSGSAFGCQARFTEGQVVARFGEARLFQRMGDEGGIGINRFCPHCGSTVWYGIEADPDFVAIPLGAFAQPGLWPVTVTVYDDRKQPWVTIEGDDIEHWV